MEADAERINLAIFLLVPSEHVSFTFLRVRLKNSLELEVVQQLVHTHAERATRRLLGIYGTEDQGLAARYTQIPCVVAEECMVCFDRRRNIVVLPCRHCAFGHKPPRALKSF